MDSSDEVSLNQFKYLTRSSLNYILLALELVICQPNIESIPDCAKNYELVQVFMKDLNLFEKVIDESKMTSGKLCLWALPNFLALDIEDQRINLIEKQMEGLGMNEEKSGYKVLVKSLSYDFECQEKKQEEFCWDLSQKMVSGPNSKKRKYKEEEGLINTFLKQVKITAEF